MTLLWKMCSRNPGEYLSEFQNDTKLEKYVLVHMYIFLVWCRERRSRTDVQFTTDTGSLVADQSTGGTGRSIHNSCRRIFDPGYGDTVDINFLIFRLSIKSVLRLFSEEENDSMSSESPGLPVWDSTRSHPPRRRCWQVLGVVLFSNFFFYISFCVIHFHVVRWRVHHKSQSSAGVGYSSFRHVQPSIVAYLIARCPCPFQNFDVGNRSEVSTKALSSLNTHI